MAIQNAGGLEGTVKKLEVGGNPVELNTTYQLPPEALWYKATPSKRRGVIDPNSPVLVLLNGTNSQEWYINNGFKQRPQYAYFVRVEAHGDLRDGGYYDISFFK